MTLNFTDVMGHMLIVDNLLDKCRGHSAVLYVKNIVPAKVHEDCIDDYGNDPFQNNIVNKKFGHKE